MRVGRGVSISRRAMLGVAGLGSAALLAMTVVGALPVRGDVTPGSGFGMTAFQVATIPQGKSSVTVKADGQVFPTSVAICTVQTDPAPRSLRYATINAAAGTLTVALDGRALAPVKVACIVVTRFGPISGPISPPVSGPISGPK